MFNIFFSKKSCLFLDNVGKYCRAGQATDDNMAHTHRVLDTNTHSEYIIVIAFPLQQWLHERASILRYTYIACLVLAKLLCPFRILSLYALQILPVSS